MHYRRETDWQDNSDQGIWKNEYEHFAEINFVTDEKQRDIFKDKLTAEAIITNLTAYLQNRWSRKDIDFV